MADWILPTQAPMPRACLFWDGTDFRMASVDAAGNVQVDVLTSALPAGAATAANQTTMITALQLIDDLRGALDSVGTDEIDVNVESLAWPITAPTLANQLWMVQNMIVYADVATIYNLTLTLANTEYSQLLPAMTRKFTVKCRGLYDVRMSFVAGETATNYITIPAGYNYWDDLIRVTGYNLRFRCATAAQVMEIVTWS